MSRKRRAILLVTFIWIASGIFSLPTAYMKTDNNQFTNYDDSTKKCKLVHLFGKSEATLSYEILLFGVMPTLAGVYMIYGKLWSFLKDGRIDK